MFSLRKLFDRVYVLNFAEQYDLAMHFLRYSEFYESAHERFWNSSFTILEYQEWYSREHEGQFSYPADWPGFNIPGRIIKQVQKAGIPDPNRYDDLMAIVYEFCARDNPDFYLIGTSDQDKSVENHEIAHALWHTNAEYRARMKAILINLNHGKRQEIHNILAALGYGVHVFEDEMQAYLATGLEDLSDTLYSDEIYHTVSACSATFDYYQTHLLEGR